MNEHEIDVARLEFHERIGSGVTATVYRGTLDQRIEVAIKEIEWNKTKLSDKHALAFDREIAIMAKVKCEHLVHYIGVVSFTVPFRIVTEYCGGGCVFELLHNDEEVDLQWCQQHKMCLDVAKAIEYLHSFSPKIIHRDLKSLNLLLTSPITSEHDRPFVKVSDFGLSRMQDKVEGHGVWGKMTVAAGTFHWMAPEVLTPNYDETCDVYSYAMIMFEIICREIPFEDQEAANVGKLILQGVRPDLAAVPDDCPKVMQDLMIMSWAQESKKRPPFTTIVRVLEPLCAQLWPGNW